MFRSGPLAVRCMHNPLPRVIGPYSALSCLIRPYRALLGLTDTQTEAHPMRFCLHPPVGAQSRNRTSDTRIFSPLLYLLSYLSKSEPYPISADREGQEVFMGTGDLDQRVAEQGAAVAQALGIDTAF